MSTKITTENGAGIAVGQLGITVAHPEGIATIWARLSQEQRRALADALDPGRDFSGVDWKTMYDQAVQERDALDSQLTRVDMECAEAVTARVAAERTCDELRSLIAGQKEHVTKTQRARDDADRRTADAESDRDKWKRHHDRVDGQWAKAERDVTRLAMGIERAERERDEWKARAEALEAEAEEAFEQGATWQKARTAPDVSRVDVEKALRASTNDVFQDEAYPHMADAICDLFGIEAEQAVDPDPVEVAIRDGLTVWGTTDRAVQEIAVSVRHVLGQEATR